MAESIRFVDLVKDRLDGFLSERTTILRALGDDLDPVLDFSREFLSGGKRFRALFCFWGWNAIAEADPAVDDVSLDAAREWRPGSNGSEAAGDRPTQDRVNPAVVSASAALEMFHAAALIHDDIIDNSDSRRGAPAAHKRFQTLHEQAGWQRSADSFGTSAAMLLGDQLLGWSDELLDDGLSTLTRERARAARAVFTRMRTEVTAGQYLDILEEVAWRTHPDTELLSRAERVVVYKSAKYSVEAPLLLGASMAGARPDQVAALQAFGLPLGVAFQLRDDVLGVFGDAAVTGKPSGDDLIEGKRTMLIETARAALPRGARSVLDELVGDPELDAEQIRMLQRTIRDSGALDEVERMIEQNATTAVEVLRAAPISRAARAQLTELATTVTARSS